MTRLLAGTSGWSYPSWQPGFYPAGLDRSAFLSFYAGRLDAVELNATKYRLPSQAQFESWAAQVPDGFRFAVKAPDGVERGSTSSRSGCSPSATVSAACASSSSAHATTACSSSCSAPPTRLSATRSTSAIRPGTASRSASCGHARSGSMRRDADAGWAYLRFRELAYDDAPSAAIAARIRAIDDGCTEVYGFFRHGDIPDAPASALRLRALLEP